MPGPARPHERLAVEAGRDQRRKQAGYRTHIEAKRRPAVLRDRAEAVEERNLRRPHVGIVAAAATVDADQRVRLLGTGAHDAARPVILEGATDEVDALADPQCTLSEAIAHLGQERGLREEKKLVAALRRTSEGRPERDEIDLLKELQEKARRPNLKRV